MKSKTYYCRIKVISPVHIGCDEVYEPTGFVVDDQEKELIAFEPATFLGMLEQDDLDKFATICRKGTVQSLLEIYKFIRLHKEHARGRRVAVSDSFISHYNKTLNLPPNAVQKQLNKFLVGRTAFQRVETIPYIPGSALKGAIRTAVLNERNGGSKHPKYRNGKQLNDDLSGGTFATDPFRLIKVSDFHATGPVGQRIVYAVNRKKKPSDREARGPYQILEVIESGAEFIGTITIQQPPRGAMIKKPVQLEEIGKGLAGFYPAELKKEKRHLQTIGCDTAGLEANSSGTHLIRIGRHSGAECVTVEGHRDIKIMQGPGVRPKFKPHATTLWLAAESDNPSTNRNLQPFGWVEFALLSEDKAAGYRAKSAAQYEEWQTEQQQAVADFKKNAELIARRKEEEIREQERQAEKERQRTKELEKYPWRAFLPGLEHIADWGGLRTQVLEQEKFIQYRMEEEVGRAVMETALQVASAIGKKWTKERDRMVAEWLQPSGVKWQSMTKDSKPVALPQKDNSGLLAQINGFSENGEQGWQEFKTAKIKINKLDKQCCEALKAKFSTWKLKKSKKKSSERKAYDNLNKRLKKLT